MLGGSAPRLPAGKAAGQLALLLTAASLACLLQLAGAQDHPTSHELYFLHVSDGVAAPLTLEQLRIENALLRAKMHQLRLLSGQLSCKKKGVGPTGG